MSQSIYNSGSDLDWTITRFEVNPVEYSLAIPFRTALRYAETVPAIEVEVGFADGRAGSGIAVPVIAVTGESLDDGVRFLRTDVAPALIARAPSVGQVGSVLRELSGQIPAARSGVEMAYRSSLGGLGEAGRIRSDATVGALDTGSAVAQAARWSSAGFEILKLKADDRSDIVEHLEAVAAAASQCRIRIDANQAWSVDRTIRIVESLAAADVDIDFVEQPTPASDLGALEAIASRLSVDVAVDESAWDSTDVGRVADLGVDAVVVKIGKAGGWVEAHKTASAAQGRGLRIVVSSMLEPPSCVLEAARLALMVAPTETHDLDAGLFFANWEQSYQPPWLEIPGGSEDPGREAIW